MSLLKQARDLVLGPNVDDVIRKCRNVIGAAPIFLQGLCQLRNLRVRTVANLATEITDGKNVWIPKVPLPADNSSEDAMDAATRLVSYQYGLGVHGIGHGNETDFAVWSVACEPRLHGLTNILEDVRQENATIANYPGVRRYLDAASMMFIHEGKDSPINAEDHPARILTGYLMYRLRHEAREEAHYEELARGAESVFRAVFPESLRMKIEPSIIEAYDARDTAHCVDLAKRLMVSIDEAREDAEKQKSDLQEQLDAAQQGDSGEGSDGGAATGGDAGSPDANDSGQEPSAAAGPTPAELQQALTDITDQINALSASLDDSASDQMLKDRCEQFAQAFEQAASDVEQSGSCGEVDMEVSSYFGSAGGSDDGHQRLVLEGRGVHNLEDGLRVSAALRSRIQREFEAVAAPVVIETSQSRGARINSRRLSRLGTGDRRIFQRSIRGEARGVDVFLLCDVSCSMKGNRIRLASQALFATACALYPLPEVAVAAGTFPGNGSVLCFGQPPLRSQDRFELVVGGGTPLGAGLYWAAGQLLQRKAPRKLVLVLTDGEPDDEGQAKNAITVLSLHGVECLALGIQSSAVVDVFPNHEVVSSLDELPMAALNMLRSRMKQPLAA